MIFNRFALDTEVRFQPFSGFNMMIVHKSNHMNIITPTVYKMPKEQAFENKDVMGEYFAEKLLIDRNVCSNHSRCLVLCRFSIV